MKNVVRNRFTHQFRARDGALTRDAYLAEEGTQKWVDILNAENRAFWKGRAHGEVENLWELASVPDSMPPAPVVKEKVGFYDV